MQPLHAKCRPNTLSVASGALQKERSPLVFPSVNDDQSSPGSAVGSLSGTWRISLGLVGKDNSRTSSHFRTDQWYCTRGSHRHHQEGKKCTQYTIVLPWGAALALRQTQETRSLRLLDSCRANGNMYGAKCARLQPMEKSETLSCCWVQMLRLVWLQHPHRRCCSSTSI